MCVREVGREVGRDVVGTLGLDVEVGVDVRLPMGVFSRGAVSDREGVLDLNSQVVDLGRLCSMLANGIGM